MRELKAAFDAIEMLLKSCDIDYDELKRSNIDESFLSDYSNQRIVNSFLFNFIKIQNKIGAKLFKKILFALKEIDDFSVPMKDVLHILEKLNIIREADDWERLREVRNALAHEYPMDISERIENIALALRGYEIIRDIYQDLKKYSIANEIV